MNLTICNGREIATSKTFFSGPLQLVLLRLPQLTLIRLCPPRHDIADTQLSNSSRGLGGIIFRNRKLFISAAPDVDALNNIDVIFTQLHHHVKYFVCKLIPFSADRGH